MEVAGQSFQSTGIQKERKEADQNAAFMALKALGLVPATIGFNTKASPGKLTIVMYTVAAVGVFTESLILQMIFQFFSQGSSIISLMVQELSTNPSGLYRESPCYIV